MPDHGLVCDATLSVFIAGFIGIGDPLVLALGIAQVSDPSLDIVLINAKFFESVYGLVVSVVYVVAGGMIQLSCLRRASIRPS